METRKPLVSVIVTTYNREEYLKYTIDSVLNQSYKNIELIVVDDGSLNDATERLCNQYGDQLSYFKIKNSGGPAKPRNYGYSKSKGKYVSFLDDDDLWIKDKLKIQVELLENNSEFGLIHSSCKVIDEKGEDQKYDIGKPKHATDKHGDVHQKMIGNWTLMMPTPLIRKSVVEKVGFFNEIMPNAGEDAEFWVRCSFVTKFYYYDKPLAYYRIHNSNASSNNKAYVNLPVYLKMVLDNQVKEKTIDNQVYKKLLSHLTRMQIKNIKINHFKAIKNLLILDKLWFFKINNIKLLIKKTVLS